MADRPRALGTEPTEAAPLEGALGSQVTSAGDAPALVASRYEILAMLGSGGMGTVYRARDRELDEIVALKVLKKELASTQGMLERFRREVKLARRVTHKNVARTFDIGEHDGDRFLTMELIEGEMLGAHLARRGRVPLRDVVAIGRDLCAGLGAAHEAGVLHRDLKPENVILARDGRAVITDFGIARAVAQAELARTGSGMVGTPAYMAPEQVEGASDLDGRADLYALGTILFELLTGTPAWSGDSIVAVAVARILRPPPDARAHLPQLSADAAALVLKLMSRARDDRFATADEAGEALAKLVMPDLGSTRSLAPTPPSPSPLPPRPSAPKTVAVLPLVNLGSEDDAYLAQSVTEDLVDRLSIVPALRVRPRGDTVRFDTASRDVREAGRALGVDVVVDGSLRRAGEMVRVSVRVITVEDGFQLWARRFDRPAAQVLSVADDAAAAVASALATELELPETRPVVDPAAQDLYLRGRYLVQRGWFDVSREGVALLARAHQLAPGDTRIAGTYALAIARVLTADADAMIQAASARELAEATLVIDPTQLEARVALAFVHLNDSEGVTAAIQLKRAQAPNAVEALDAAGRVLIEVGRWQLGVATLRRVLAIDPLMVHARHAIARAQALTGDHESALETLGPFSAAANLIPDILLRGRIALWRGDRAGARVLAEAVARSRPGSVTENRIGGLLHIAQTGEAPPELTAQLDASVPIDSRFAPRRLSFHAQVRAELRFGAGQLEQGLVELRTADDSGLIDRLWLEACPLLDAVRDSPEYAAIQRSTARRTDRIIEVLDPSSP
jgi:serine/threonine-protein kinase